MPIRPKRNSVVPVRGDFHTLETRYRSRRLRGDASPAERKLWQELRSKKFHGVRFRRQHPIGPYFPDFICLKAKLIVEVDGTSHRVPEQIEHDIRRTKYLEQLGYEVLRATNAAVLTDMAGVLTRIDAALAARLPPPSREAWRGDAEGAGED